MKYEIRLADESDIEHLPAIEQAASELFADTEYAMVVSLPCLNADFLRERQRSGKLWVASAKELPVGFAVITEIDGNAHLHELSIHPDHQRRGLGRKLVDAVSNDAVAAGFTAITLSTFSEVPWNAPFYASLGFRPVETPTLSAGYRALRIDETNAGLNVAARVIMSRAL